MNRGAVLACVAVAGIGLMVWLTPRVHPAAIWSVQCDRETAQVRAREMSALLGVDTSGWSASVSGRTETEPAFFQLRHPEIAEARRFSSLYPKVALGAPAGSERIVVMLSASGQVNSWAVKGYKEAKSLDVSAARTLAAGALTHFVGKDADTFRPVPGPSENEGTLVFAFERHEPMRERFEATVNGSRLVKAELKALYGHEIDEAMHARQKYLNWLGVAASVIYFWGVVLAIGVYVFWAVRRAIRYRFVLPLSATPILWGAVYWSNWMGYDQRYDSLVNHESFAGNFGGAVVLLCFWILLYFVLTGATDAIGLRSKLATLRSLFTASAFNKQAGFSIWAGMLCGPLLAALPLAVSSLRLFGSERTGNYDSSLLFAAHPGVQALDVQLPVALLGVFGLGAAQLPRFFRKAWLSAGLLAICSIPLLATIAAPAETNPLPLLLGAALLFVAYQLLFTRIDLLAVLSAGWCATVLWNASCLVLQPAPSLHASGMAAFVALAALVGCAGLVALRGRVLAIDESVAPAAVTSQREALMKEFSIAHRVQQEMLPERPPEIPGCSVAASCQPAQEVGGDLFDFLQLPDGRWTIGVGDVSGKGVPAALYMTLTKGLLMATTQDSSDLADIIGHVNRHIHAATEKKTFVTMALGAFDPETREFDHVRAGHNPVVWRSMADGATSLLNAPGLGLGIVSDKLFRRSIKLQRLQLKPGDALVFYSDGVTEAMNAEREQFGEERLMRSIEEADGLDASGVRERIVASVKEFLEGIAPQDDMTVVVLRVN